MQPNRQVFSTRATLTAALALSLVSIGLHAQAPAAAPAPDTAAAPSATTDTADSGAITKMAQVNVNDVPVTEQVLPTVRPVGDVMGDESNIIDIPRSVSSVNQAWMRDRMVKNAMDLGQFSPGVYSAAQYGIPAVPFIRGDLSQIYTDGQIALFSRNSTPPSFNGVEAFDIVKGPGSAVYGPQGEGAGGYVDFVMKQPYFDGLHFDTDLTLGYLTSGHSYSNPEATLDFGGPISDKLAYRVSYLSRYGDGYYINDHDETQDGYFALSYRATQDLHFDFWMQAYADRTNEISGTNRVTQQFIDNGTYVGGAATPATSGVDAYYGYDIVTYPNPPAGTYGTATDGSHAIVNPATLYTVKLPAYDALIGPSDTARSKTFQSQLKTTLQLGPDLFLVDRAYFANGSSDKYETYGYDEYVPKTQSIQDRLEAHDKFTLAGMENDLIAGGDFRFSALTAYQDYTTEPFSYYDLYQPLSNIEYPGYVLEGHTWGSGLQVPGRPGFSGEASSGNQMSKIYDTAAFGQDDIKLLPMLSLIAGYRIDAFEAEAKNPSFVEVGHDDASTDYQYVPLAAPVYIPAGSSGPNYTGFDFEDTKYDPSYFFNLVFKLNDDSSIYATYDHVDSVLGSANFGGVNGSSPTTLANSLSTKSTLYEFGYKESFLHNTLYFSAALFQQIKVGSEITGATYPIKDNGLELEAVYQPTKNWTFNGNFTYQQATAYGDDFFQETGNYLDGYATTTIVDGKPGTGIGAVNYGDYEGYAYDPPGNRMRAPGIPQVQANFFVEYKDPLGWGIGMGPQILGRQYANDQDTLHIPGEYELDGYVFYGQKHWDVRINVKNITNQRLIDPIDVSFAGNDTIFVRPPISASITFRYHL